MGAAWRNARRRESQNGEIATRRLRPWWFAVRGFVNGKLIDFTFARRANRQGVKNFSNNF
jgi:hypothetical protein